MATEEKTKLRKEIKRIVESMTAAERVDASATICRRLLEMPEMSAAKVILGYSPLWDEVDIRPALRELMAQGKTIVLPSVDENCDIYAVPSDLEHLEPAGPYGIPEPPPGNIIQPDEIDFVITPARAADHDGARMGRGGGCYDRFFMMPGFRAYRCAVAFQKQVFVKIPREPHDVLMQAIVTESSVIKFARQ